MKASGIMITPKSKPQNQLNNVIQTMTDAEQGCIISFCWYNKVFIQAYGRRVKHQNKKLQLIKTSI